MANTAWYHGGNFKEGMPKGTYVYVTGAEPEAIAYARNRPNGRLYRLRPEHNHLVKDHHAGGGRKVILQADLIQIGGALCAFEELNGEAGNEQI